MKRAAHIIQQRLADRQQAGNYRTLKPESNLIDFCSNDYLGFAQSPELKLKIAEEIAAHPESSNGSTGSRLLAGNLSYTEQLEASIAAYHKAEAGLLFNSGYDANIGLFSCLPQRGDTIILDELAHASIIDGARLSNANRYTFKHNDLQSLADKLKAAKGTIYIGIESVYSMDGDASPIAEILDLADAYNAAVIVDEAHAIGLYKTGLVQQLGLHERVFARVITFGKAIGCHGAIILGNNDLRNYLINFARSFIYTTAASFHQVASIKMAYEFLNGADVAISALQNNIALFKNNISKHRDYLLIESDSAIQCIILKNNHKAKQIATALQQTGIDVRPILSPTVPQGSERIRICLHSYNSTADIALLTNTINKFLNER
ncbi:8-amino-7-oxononanoate synthase [Mucilaginibacter sp. UR6-1]|uniref:aminotransferase class I/II-fold pyridoxal phosphate-dependent enzyme n=1 Tax=Mucilaginibacter sp. UR6-1 TaxID=1435643 RepID=UPI001E4C792E|nr:8-amino-7-oxononanoate synthase [Mucilaginibacter sp. UR6-1]MCC8409194.1 8-amino-7-oxononanoate synthase [Mucilaginibacter sp. UR6-1]